MYGTPTLDRPRTATSGPSGTGSCENLPTVKRRIGAGEKSSVERRISFGGGQRTREERRKDVGNGGDDRPMEKNFPSFLSIISPHPYINPTRN